MVNILCRCAGVNIREIVFSVSSIRLLNCVLSQASLCQGPMPAALQYSSSGNTMGVGISSENLTRRGDDDDTYDYVDE